jgi:hypothetical protein
VTERIEGETISDIFDSQRVRPLVTDLEGRSVRVLRAFHHTTRTACHPMPAPQSTQVIPTSRHLRVSCWATGSASLRARWAGWSGGVLRRKPSATRWDVVPSAKTSAFNIASDARCLSPNAPGHFRCVTPSGLPLRHLAGVSLGYTSAPGSTIRAITACSTPNRGSSCPDGSTAWRHSIGELAPLLPGRRCPQGVQGVLVVIHCLPSSQKPCPAARFPLALRPLDPMRRSGHYPLCPPR